MGKKINIKAADILKAKKSVLNDEEKVDILYEGIMKMVKASKLKGYVLIPTFTFLLADIIYGTCDEDKRGIEQWLEISKRVSSELLRALTEATNEFNKA